ncbi:conserved hypothetical protein [Ricinus communis]|uniref:Uncharacterized protein n=1 Tax=Ricinus communis TaxID=3988 RepID=B9T4P3_RICCO|nr:conserved hypothetical protein [Ricinus communis]
MQCGEVLALIYKVASKFHDVNALTNLMVETVLRPGSHWFALIKGTMKININAGKNKNGRSYNKVDRLLASVALSDLGTIWIGDAANECTELLLFNASKFS